MTDNFFDRIEGLFDIGAMGDARIFVPGCGSGGGAVALQLAMSGITNFTLADNDTLEPPNVIRHVCGIRDLGRKKVDALADMLLDRNPAIQVTKRDVDLMQYPDLQREIETATLVIMATDNEPTRHLINDICVKTQTPFVVGKVFTRGIGGEVYSFRPGESGCLACLEKVLERTQFRSGIREIDLVSEEERNKIYGMEIPEIKDSPGLNVDIAFITAFHTRFALDSIASRCATRPKNMPSIEENYIVWGNRPVPPFTKNFQLQRINVRPQEGCMICGN
jgi:molybdopterin/thiamine biosynthesis adenylyltransferase